MLKGVDNDNICHYNISQSELEKHNQEKTHNPLRTSWISQQMCPPFLMIIQSCYFGYRTNKPFACSRCVFFLLCSLDLDVLRAQRIIGFFILTTHKSTRSEHPVTWYCKPADAVPLNQSKTRTSCKSHLLRVLSNSALVKENEAPGVNRVELDPKADEGR